MRGIVIGLAAMCSFGCSGMAGAHERSSELVVATHCDRQDCTPPPRARHLGEGCYVVHHAEQGRDYLYDCSTDLLPAGAVMCTDVTPCSGACEQTITYRGIELPITRCRPRWYADRAARRPPLTCSPARLQGLFEPPATTAAASVPSTLELPVGLVTEVMRSGTSRVVYTAEVCATSDGVVVSEPTRRTRFPELDRVLHQTLGELAIAASPDPCAIVTLVVSRFECDVEPSLL